MLLQLIIGTVIIVITLLTQVIFISSASHLLDYYITWFTRSRKQLKMIIALVLLTLWILAGLSAAVWVWAIAYVLLDVIPSLEEAVYFSTVAFTTLGFGDITLDENWRVMSGMMAANGLVLFSLNTAFMFEALRSISIAEDEGLM